MEKPGVGRTTGEDKGPGMWPPPGLRAPDHLLSTAACWARTQPSGVRGGDSWRRCEGRHPTLSPRHLSGGQVGPEKHPGVKALRGSGVWGRRHQPAAGRTQRPGLWGQDATQKDPIWLFAFTPLKTEEESCLVSLELSKAKYYFTVLGSGKTSSPALQEHGGASRTDPASPAVGVAESHGPWGKDSSTRGPLGTLKSGLRAGRSRQGRGGGGISAGGVPLPTAPPHPLSRRGLGPPAVGVSRDQCCPQGHSAVTDNKWTWTLPSRGVAPCGRVGTTPGCFLRCCPASLPKALPPSRAPADVGGVAWEGCRVQRGPRSCSLAQDPGPSREPERASAGGDLSSAGVLREE